MAFSLDPRDYCYLSFAPTYINSKFIEGGNISYSYLFQDYRQKFNNLSATWKHETKILSSGSEILLNTAYQEIIGMGDKVLPYIFNELKHEPNQWFWALKSITGYDPIKPTQMGDLSQMSKAWLSWGTSKGYV